jgi:3-deoxy-D-arabino-heptulosonate 7-phosphate (DAHP) synthase
MLEVHPDPARAASDNAQQLTPADFLALMRTVRDGLSRLAPPAPEA